MRRLAELRKPIPPSASPAERAARTEERRYLEQKVRSGKALLTDVSERQNTLRKVAQAIVDAQQDYFEKGPAGLRPLVMAQIAEVVGVHETTVSRAVAGKYVRSPQGIRELRDFHPDSRMTNIAQAVEFLTGVAKRRCTAFLLSDFYTQDQFRQQLTIANRKHDVVAIQVYDKRAAELPNVGLMRVVDAETGIEQYVDTSSRKLRESYHKTWLLRQSDLNETFAKSNVDHGSIATDEDYVKSLLVLFKQRG